MTDREKWRVRVVDRETGERHAGRTFSIGDPRALGSFDPPPSRNRRIEKHGNIPYANVARQS